MRCPYYSGQWSEPSLQSLLFGIAVVHRCMQMVTSFSQACIVFSNYPKAGNSFLNNYVHTLIRIRLKKPKNTANFLENLHTKDLIIYFLTLLILFRAEKALEVLKFCQ